MEKECLICKKVFYKPKYKSIKNWISRTKYCSKQCSGTGNFNRNRLGAKHTEESKRKMSESHKDKFLGENSPNWKGGYGDINYKIRRYHAYIDWRKKIFQRDDFKCQDCGQVGGNLNADHIKPLSVIIRKNNIKSIEEAKLCDEVWDTNNGQTLCKLCHTKTSTWGVKAIRFNEMLG